MEDKRTALALFVCIVFIMLYSQLFITPLTEQHARSLAPSTSTSQTASSSPSTSPAQTQQQIAQQNSPAQSPAAYVPPATEQAPTHGEVASAGILAIDSATVSLDVSLLGGRITRYNLKDYKLHLNAGDLVNMVHTGETGAYPGAVLLGASLSDAFVKYTLSSSDGTQSQGPNSFVIPLGAEGSFALSGTLPNGIGIQKIFKFRPNAYMFDVDVRLSNPSSDGSNVWLEWNRFVSDPELHDRLDPPQFTTLSASSNKLQHIVLNTLVTSGATIFPIVRELGDNTWVALNDKYFMATLIPPQGGGQNSRTVIEPQLFSSRVQGTPTGGTFSLYVGPKDYRILKELGFNLHRTIDLGIFSFLAFPLISAIRFFEAIFGNYGLAIILLTLLIKTLFLPLTKASMDSMRAMQDIQPEVKALRERIKDASQLNQEMMALYKRKGVNPMGGCLPMLIQIPVFLGLYNALLYSIELRHAPFALWITDLSAKEELLVWGVPVPVMILLMGASMFFQQYTSPQPTADPAQRKVMLMMPVIFTVMFVLFPFPSGLVLYWLVNNVISITQQVYLRSHRKASPLVATVVASVCIFCFGFVLTLLGK